MRVGIISLQWLPLPGGANIYAHRVARALRARGHTVEIATGTPASEDRDNGALPAFRSPSPVPEEPAACREWYARLEPWLREHRFTHVLVNAPLSRPEHSHARELYRLAQRSGARVGAIHYDIGRGVANELNWAYALTGSWEQAAQRALEKIRAHPREPARRVIGTWIRRCISSLTSSCRAPSGPIDSSIRWIRVPGWCFARWWTTLRGDRSWRGRRR